MKYQDSTSNYGIVTILLHWFCASLIIFLFGLGVYMRGLDYYSPWYHQAPVIHISLGLLIFALMLIRILWRARNQTPARINTISTQTHLAASLVKILLYVFTFIICLSGYLITTAEGQPAHFFELLSIPAVFELNASFVDLAGATHKYVAWGIIGLALLHGSAALFHHFIKRDATLLRMLNPK